MKRLSIDIETYSPIALNKTGVYRYAEDVEILLVAWAWGDEPVTVWDMTAGDATNDDVQQMIDEADEVVVHNSNFERTVFRACGIDLPVTKIDDAMVVALLHGLPGALGMLCDVLGVPQDKAKDKDGKKLINLFCKPRPKNVKLRRATRETHPDEWQRFIQYAGLDVDAMRSVRERLPRWNDTDRERNLWRLDQDVNDAGIAVDVELATAALRAFERASGALATAAAGLTDGAVTSTTQRAKLIGHLEEVHGFGVADLTKATVDRLLRDESTPPEVRELLENRQQAAATSPAKYRALLEAVGRDGRLRGTIQFSGAARTARDAGRIFQPQNLPRPTMSQEQIEFGIACMKADCEDLLYA